MVDWTETRIAKLKLLHKEGLSGAAIAKKLGPAFTKGMVIGKLRRLELASKAAKSKTGWTKKAPPPVGDPSSKGGPAQSPPRRPRKEPRQSSFPHPTPARRRGRAVPRRVSWLIFGVDNVASLSGMTARRAFSVGLRQSTRSPGASTT